MSPVDHQEATRHMNRLLCERAATSRFATMFWAYFGYRSQHLKFCQHPLRHGLTAQLALLPGEDPEAYHIHSQVFAGDHDPQGSIEASLVQFLADVTWRLNRLTILESNLMTALIGLAGPALAAAVETQSKAMANFSIYSQRLTRQFERTASELRDLQKTRKLQDLKELNQMFDIISKYQDNELPSTQPAMASFFHRPKSNAPRT